MPDAGTNGGPDDGLVGRLRAAGCVFAEDEADLLVAELAGSALEEAVVRRVTGEPLEQILGWAELCGLRIRLLPGVFVPRQRSALLVDAALARLSPGAPVFDVCCGSGALGAVIAARAPSSPVYATDLDPDAVACARLNLPADRVFEGDLFAALPKRLRGRAGVVLAHAPYVPTADIASMPPEARDHEHRVALDGGPDGLDVVRRVLTDAPRWLAPHGSVLFECSTRQVDAALDAVSAAGLFPDIVSDHEAGATVVVGDLVRRRRGE